MKLGILILQYNSVEYTEQLARGIPEAIIIDNGSDRMFSGTNRVIRLDRNYGFTIGWIKGIEAVWDEFDAFWLCNNDIELSRESIDRVQKVLDSGQAEVFTPSYNGWAKEYHNQGTGGLRDVGCIEFCAPVITKKALEEVGGFDARFSLGYGVEFDWCYRARMKGYKIMVDDGSSFYHYGQRTTGVELKRTLEDHERKANNEKNVVMMDKYGYGWTKILFNGISLTTDLKTSVLVYTTIFGDYDELFLVPRQRGYSYIDYICVTDNPNLTCPPPWKLLVVEAPFPDNPRLSAKYYKLQWFRDETLNKYGKNIYIDATIKIISSSFVLTALRNLRQFKTYRHPFRKTIQDELVESLKLKKYQDISRIMTRQVKTYLKSGFPDNVGLWAMGVQARVNNKEVHQVMDSWWRENLKYTIQDQLSFPYVCWKLGFAPEVFEGNQGRNHLFEIWWHDDGHPPRLSSTKPGMTRTTGNKQPEPARPHQTHRQVPAVVQWPALKDFSMTVVLPVYNTPKQWLHEAVLSIQGQTDQRFKVVVIDDGSTLPETVNYLDELKARNPEYTLFRFPENVKLARALNKALELVDTELVVRLDADDLMLNNLIAQQRKYFQTHPQAICVGVQLRCMGKHEKVTQHPETVTARKAKTMPGYWFVNHPGVCYRKDVVMSVGGYGDTLLPCEDYWLWTELLKKGYEINNIDQVLLRHRVVEGRTSTVVACRDFLEKCKRGL